MASLLGKFKKVLPTGRFARAVGLVALGTVLGQALIVLAAPLLTRLYTAENFGALTVFTSLYTIFVSMNSLAYELAIPLPPEDTDSANLLILVLVLVVATTVVYIGAIALLEDPLIALTNTPELDGLLWLLPMGLLAGGFYQGLNYWSVRKKAYRSIALSRIGLGASIVVVQIGMGLMAVGAVGLVVGQVASLTTAAVMLSIGALHTHHTLFQRVNLSTIWHVASRYRRFPQYTSWSNLLNTAGLNLPGLLIAVLYGPAIAGLFILGQRVIGAPMALLGTSVSQVYLGTAAELKRTDPAGLQRLFNQTSRRLLLIGALPMLILILFGPQLFAFVFGGDWELSGQFVQFLAPAMLIQFTVSPIAQTIFVLERQDLQLRWDLGRVVLLVAIFLLASWLNWQPVVTVGVYAAGYAAAYAILLWMYRRELRVLVEKEMTEWQSESITNT